MRENIFGFTLVELSIVLVIIGLLIGGILVGQSLTEAAQINSQIQQIMGVEVAINGFRTKFRGLPGDSDKIGDAAGTSPSPGKICAGNNDGIIGAVGNRGYSLEPSPTTWNSGAAWGGNPHYCNNTHAEWTRVFENMGVTSMYKWKLYINSDESYPEYMIPGIGYPAMKLPIADGVTDYSKGGLVVGYMPANSTAGLEFMRAGNKIAIGACNSGNSTALNFYCPPAPRAMLAIDKKMDDGLPNSGDVYIGAGRYAMRPDESGDCTVGGAYRSGTALDTPLFYCGLVIDMGI